MLNKFITKKVICVFLILGVIISPLFLAALLACYDKEAVVIGLGEFFITIPLGVYSVNKVKHAESKSSLIIIAIIDIIVLFVVGGLLILFSKSSIYKKEKREGEFDYKKAIDYDTVIDYKEDDDSEW
ncbi:MAG: hypothetical protein K6E20_01840 [Acholeplasmatales bacterium]|nr:hypothetical protein [Acholeplasmatales bacterium]